MTPTEIDDIAAKMLLASGAAHVEIILTMPDWSTVTHQAGKHPEDSAITTYDQIKHRVRVHHSKGIEDEAG